MQSIILFLIQRFSMYLMYNYAEFNSELFGIFFFLYHLYNIKHNFWLLNSELNLYFSLLKKNSVFQYSFVAINYFFIIVSVTVFCIFRSERKLKINITVKNPLTNNCNKMLGTNKKFFQLN